MLLEVGPVLAGVLLVGIYTSMLIALVVVGCCTDDPGRRAFAAQALTTMLNPGTGVLIALALVGGPPAVSAMVNLKQ